MATTATLTSKGQTTIPAKIREYLHLTGGDRIEFIIENKGKVLIAPANIDVKELAGILPKPKKPVSLAQMDKAIRQRSIKRCMA